MASSVREKLAEKGIYPSDERLKQLEQNFQQINELRDNLDGVITDTTDIALRNIPGDDHV